MSGTILQREQTEHSVRSTSHASTTSKHISRPQIARTFTCILLNPDPLEADGVNCRVASIFKLDIFVISSGRNIVMEFINTEP